MIILLANFFVYIA